MSNMDIEVEHILCECTSEEHTVRFSWFKDTDPDFRDAPEIYMSIFLSKPAWWQRVLIAAKYIFGYQSVYGSWDNVLFGRKQLHVLANFLNDRIADEKEHGTWTLSK